MGNMRRELSSPIITSCQVNSILPETEEGKSKWESFPLPGGGNAVKIKLAQGEIWPLSGSYEVTS